MRAKLRAITAAPPSRRGESAAAALAVVVVAHDHPARVGRAQLARALRDSLRRLARERVSGAQEQVVAELVQVAAEAQPGTGGRDVIGRGLAARLEQDRQV